MKHLRIDVDREAERSIPIGEVAAKAEVAGLYGMGKKAQGRTKGQVNKAAFAGGAKAA